MSKTHNQKKVGSMLVPSEDGTSNELYEIMSDASGKHHVVRVHCGSKDLPVPAAACDADCPNGSAEISDQDVAGIRPLRADVPALDSARLHERRGVRALLLSVFGEAPEGEGGNHR